MQDIIYIAIIIAFFALMAMFTVGVERIIGSDEDNLILDENDDEGEPDELAA